MISNLIDPKPLHCRFNKRDGFIRIYGGTKYLTSFNCEKYEAIYDTNRYLICQKVVSDILFLTIFQKLMLILMIICLMILFVIISLILVSSTTTVRCF